VIKQDCAKHNLTMARGLAMARRRQSAVTTDSLAIDEPSRSDQFMVTRCVVWEVAGCAHNRATRHDRVSRKADEKLQQAKEER
jgi:hypothetical protein